MTGLHIRPCAIALLVLFPAFVSCRRPTPGLESFRPARVNLDPASLKGGKALEQVRRFLETGPRESGTPGAGKAASYLVAELQRLGVKAEVDEFEDETPNGRKTFRNVVGHVGVAGGRVIVLGSHYDTKAGISPGFQGANDSGSSTGLLLELASVLRAAPLPETEVLIVFFDGEECSRSYGRHDGLHGSRRLAGTLVERGDAGRVVGAVILDMIGDRDLNIGIPLNSTPGLCSAVFAAAHQEGVRSKFCLSRSAVLDDHVPFLDAGMPAVDIIDFSYGSAAGLNDYWHTEDDTIDKLSAENLETVGRITIRLINFLSGDGKDIAQ